MGYCHTEEGCGCLREARPACACHIFWFARLALVLPWPPQHDALFDEAFAELARRWLPVLDLFDHHGIDLCYEIHPGEDLHDGVTFERFLAEVNHHPRCNILFDPAISCCNKSIICNSSTFIIHASKPFTLRMLSISLTGAAAFTAAISPGWPAPDGFDRLAMVRSTSAVSSASWRSMAMTDGQYWSGSVAWKDSETGAREGAEFIRGIFIPVSDRAFDDFALAENGPSVRHQLGPGS